MYPKSIFIVIVAFIVGVLCTVAVNYYTAPIPTTSTTYVVANADSVKEDEHFVTRILGLSNEELPSPYNWIPEHRISVEKDKVVIKVENAQWSRFTDTNSMDPVIDDGANAIQIVPNSEADIHVGDIVSYESNYADGVIIHRVIEIGFDKDGWYAKMKGDNNSREDPGLVRFNQIKRITIAIIY